MKALRPSLWFVVAATLLAGCARRDRYVPPPSAALVVVPVGLARPDGDAPVVFAEVASTPDRRSRGLGGRDHLDPDTGMLFVYAEDAPHRYWMKDCFIGLDIAFIRADRRIAALATLPPGAGMPDAAVPSTDSGVPVRYVLETAPGWLAAHGIRAGDEVDLEAALVGVEPR